MSFFIKLGRHASHGQRMDPIEFLGQRLKVKVTIDIYRNKLVSTIETKPLCASSSNLADVLAIVRRRTLLNLEVKVTINLHGYKLVNKPFQRSKVKFTIDMYMYGNKLVNTIYRLKVNVVCLFIELGRHVYHGERMNSIDFGCYRSKVKVTMCIIDKCGVRGDATLCIVIFQNMNQSNTLPVHKHIVFHVVMRIYTPNLSKRPPKLHDLEMCHS